MGLLMALVIGLSLAYCGIQKAHIDVSLVVDLFPTGWRYVVGGFINIISAFFLAASAWYVGVYARNIMDSGMVTSTTHKRRFTLLST
ncbi:MAG: TRAP transporter small permease subunit [Candidatus Syntrophopropionicum ammoniitolerans]